MRETIIILRVRNAKLECALASKSARNAIRRIRTELARRGLTTAQREGILHDNLLMLAECESSGGDPVEILLGTANVSSFDAAINAFCDGVAPECPRLPTALVVVRFFALMLVALAVVLAAHLAYRVGSKPPGGWLPWYMVNLRTFDMLMFNMEVVLVATVFLIVQIVSARARRNPWPHALPAVAAPLLHALLMWYTSVVGVITLPGGVIIFNPLVLDSIAPIVQAQASMRAMFPGEFGSVVYTSDQPWMNVNYLILFAVIAIVLVLSALVVYLIESRNPRT